MPFVTEELWDRFGYGAPFSLIRAPWPEPAAPCPARKPRAAELDWVVRLISAVRSVRTEVHVAAGTPIPVRLRDAAPATLERAQRWMEAIRRLARVSDLAALEGDMPRGSAQAVLDEATLVLPLAELIDVAAEQARLGRERDKAVAEAQKVTAEARQRRFRATCAGGGGGGEPRAPGWLPGRYGASRRRPALDFLSRSSGLCREPHQGASPPGPPAKARLCNRIRFGVGGGHP